MRYAIKINQAGESGAVSKLALDFIRALLNQGHALELVFFYHSAVEEAFRQPEISDQGWGGLASQAGLSLYYCTSAAEIRKMRDDARLPFIMPGGLSLWVAACQRADRVISFGS